ncbi:sulfite exporter TauE/SafE family protein [Sphingomonas baiyangensis]|uniref:Probable membrane transporter protein n=1 Tax=Sphingomonas baiyangensis TaxID=2572576 RepID=A0A4U1L3F5_9SPHN|nr:sulfite exporter TauE/SafE family protein [Sphingomonas baiyangensis]TKD50635.1 sulfite exporter TauE/SafE family protein [Sphingomonas baiyangensis]
MLPFEFSDLLPYIAVGLAAQIVDGALGMAFGVISSTLLVSVLGVPPATASAGVHLVECFTTGVSGISHALHRNINWRLFFRLLIPGVFGGVTGAYLLTSLDADVTRPFVMTYLAAIGIYLLVRGLRFPPKRDREPKVIEPLGLAGGFLDAAGGGGWGPVVTSNLLIQGAQPRTTIGTVNSVEFFLTVSISITFLLSLGFAAFSEAVVGLLIGGVIAAPFGALVAKRVPTRALLVMVGIVLTATSSFAVYQALTR